MSTSSYPIAPEGLEQTEAPIAATAADEAFSRRDWLATALAMFEALLWVLVFDPWELFATSNVIPGVGVTLITVVGFACAYGLLKDRLRITRPTLCLNAATLLLALTFSLFSDQALRQLNCLALWIVGTLTLCLTCGMHARAWYSLRTVSASLRFFFSSLFANLTEPLKAASIHYDNRKTRGAQPRTRRLPKGTCAGIVAAVVMLVVVTPLLASADAVFGSLFEHSFSAMLDQLTYLDLFKACTYSIMFLILTPFLFSLLYGTLHADLAASSSMQAHRSASLLEQIEPVTVCIVLAAIDCIYALFVVVQFVYLFGGSEAPAMHGGYAEYARSGFFQLAAVSVINTALGLVAAKCSAVHEQGRSILRMLTIALIMLACVILASAAWRMSLYIGAYGLSKLRLGTLFIMAFCAILFVTVLVKLFVMNTKVFRVFFTAGLSLWLVFNYLNPGVLVANYNAELYLSGQTEEIDMHYLEMLGPDARGALQRIASETTGVLAVDARNRISYIDADQNNSWQYWNLSRWQGGSR